MIVDIGELLPDEVPDIVLKEPVLCAELHRINIGRESLRVDRIVISGYIGTSVVGQGDIHADIKGSGQRSQCIHPYHAELRLDPLRVHQIPHCDHK